MAIPERDLREFMKVFREEFGQELSVDEAQEMATNLVQLYELLMQPLPREIEEMDQQKDENQSAFHTPS